LYGLFWLVIAIHVYRWAATRWPPLERHSSNTFVLITHAWQRSHRRRRTPNRGVARWPKTPAFGA
ncbi:MAG: hypothetical protein M3Y74_18755, partial [Chloroflexota bacterium]|nr:hypothetical protein [Chloroflexota bacterium]